MCGLSNPMTYQTDTRDHETGGHVPDKPQMHKTRDKARTNEHTETTETTEKAEIKE